VIGIRHGHENTITINLVILASDTLNPEITHNGKITLYVLRHRR
jgi:hypothetical protein